jgi:hypothetical protein
MMRWKGVSAGISAILIMSMLIACTLGFGVAIQQRVIAPPELDLRIGGFRILAVIASPTHSSTDTVSTPCAPRREGCCASNQEFYLVWVLAATRAIDHNRPISARLLTLPLLCT